MTWNEIPWWAGTFCSRCGRELLLADGVRREWIKIVDRANEKTELVCPHCLTDEDIQRISDSLLVSE